MILIPALSMLVRGAETAPPGVGWGSYRVCRVQTASLSTFIAIKKPLSVRDVEFVGAETAHPGVRAVLIGTAWRALLPLLSCCESQLANAYRARALSKDTG